MDLREALRSTAAFTDRSVSDETIAAILDDARFAPSGGNRQPWRVAVLKDPAVRRSLADAMQPVWDEYVVFTSAGHTPFTAVPPAGYSPPADRPSHAPNPLHARYRPPHQRGSACQPITRWRPSSSSASPNADPPS